MSQEFCPNCSRHTPANLCGKCGETTEVIKTWQTGTKLRRRRKCMNVDCQNYFTTTEIRD